MTSIGSIMFDRALRQRIGTRGSLLDDSMFMTTRWRAAGNSANREIVTEAVRGFTALPVTVAKRELARQHDDAATAIR